MMRTHLVTFYGIHAKRGREAMDDLGVLPAFTGTLVSDALASYTIYGNTRALCGAHVLRELIAVTEDTRRDPAWANTMIQTLIDAKDAVADAAAPDMTPWPPRHSPHSKSATARPRCAASPPTPHRPTRPLRRTAMDAAHNQLKPFLGSEQE
nr:IS66 family transposase [Streptomyces sp. NBC_00830]